MKSIRKKHKKVSIILKVFTIFTAFVGGIFFFLYLPSIIHEMADMYPEAEWLYFPGLIGIWLIAGLCYVSLFFFWRICTQIGKDNSFSKENIVSMKVIGGLSIAVFCLIIGGTIFLGVIHYLGLGILVLVFFFLFAASGIAVLALSLSALIANAMQLKEENDLTI